MKNFDDIIIDCTKHGRKIKKGDYLEEGQYPIIDQGQQQCIGYSNETEGIFTDVPAIIFGDHTRIIKYIDEPFFLGADGVKVLRSKDSNVDYRYLYYALRNVRIENTGYNRHFKWLKESKFRYPELKQQQEVALVLGKIERIIELKEKQLEELDGLIKSQFDEMFGNPVSNPKQWKVLSLEDACSKLTDGTHFSPENLEMGDCKYITAKNIKLSGFDFKGLTYITKEVHDGIYSRCNPEHGDVLYIKDGATTGIAMVNSLDEEFSLLSSVALLKQNREIINGYYLCSALNNSEMYSNIRGTMGGAAITRLTITKLKQIKLPIPPIEIQNQFAHFIQQIDKLKIEVQNSLVETQALFDSLMQKYFD